MCFRHSPSTAVRISWRSVATSPTSLSVKKNKKKTWQTKKFILFTVHDEKCPHISYLLFQGGQINEAACNLAREVANEGDALVAGCVSKTPCYQKSRSEPEVKAIFKKQMDDFLKKNIDFFIVEV